MGKLILLCFLGVVVWWMWRKLKTADISPPSQPLVQPVELASCARCGLNLPRSESVASNGHWYCCDQHRREAEASMSSEKH